jgi:hypothetical protein
MEELDSGMKPASAVAATAGIPKMIRRCRETTQA